MKEQTLKSWEQFEDVLIRTISDTRDLKEKTESYVSYPLLRGHSNSEWHLESSLERIKKGICLSDYYTTMKIAHEHVATCTGSKWDLSTRAHFGDFELPAYEFMAYLRHNGFPSPLLDWTRSPYVAAYFAFRDMWYVGDGAAYVSIFI